MDIQNQNGTSSNFCHIFIKKHEIVRTKILVDSFSMDQSRNINDTALEKPSQDDSEPSFSHTLDQFQLKQEAEKSQHVPLQKSPSHGAVMVLIHDTL